MAPLLERAQREADEFPLPAAEFFSQLGRCHDQLGSAAVARDLFGQALAIRRAHPEAAVLAAESETDLAQLLVDTGQPTQAVSALREALAHLRAASGESNAQGVDIWSQLGQAYEREGNLREAEASYRQALDISLTRFGAGHPRSSRLQYLLARVLARSGRLSESAGLLDQAHDSLLSRSNPDLARLAEIDSLRGWLALERDQPADALPELADALAMWRRREPTTPHVRETCWLAQARVASGRDPSGDDGMHACLAGLKTDPGPEAPADFANLVQAALDRNALERAGHWLDVARSAQPGLEDGDAFKLAQARLFVATGAADATALVATLLAKAGKSAEARHLHWQAQALRASLSCRAGPGEGAALRAGVLAEALREEPERIALQHRLAAITSGCATSPATRVRDRLP
jgi:serine/threonine-protein kinase